MDELCSGGSNKELRHYLKGAARNTWQLVNWLIHDRDANKTASFIAIHACDAVVGRFIQILERGRADRTEGCPLCKSRKIRTHFDSSLGQDGEYHSTCAVCEWSGHPSAAKSDTEAPG
jgi:hypothetical protein